MKTSLYYREGSSDKEYHVEVVPSGGLFLVNFAYGRRGSTLNTGTKTRMPVDEAKARDIFAKLVREKQAKGYTEGANGAPYQHSAEAGRVSGLLPQLLNPVEEQELQRLFEHDNWCLQQKYDGRRLLIEKTDRAVHGINRRGLLCGLPSVVLNEAQQIDGDFVIDGEIIGENYFAFDILARDGQPLLIKSYRERLSILSALLADAPLQNICAVETFQGADAKKRQFCALRDKGAEGVVFKLLPSPYAHGRPASGGPALKFKFCADGAFVVQAVNANRRSVSLCLYDGATPVNVGNVTVPPNPAVPAAGEIVQVRYLYAFPESRALFQPVYQWSRDDLDPQDCTVDQLKFKRQEADDDDQ
jgi:bifunctional non-homologous end joining protein LigD